MKKLAVFIVALFFFLPSFSQYWQQKVDYVIDVSLNDKDKTLDAFEKISYFNNSPDTLHFIWFHLWPNAYRNDLTAFSDQLLENGNTEFYFSEKEEKGYINRLDFKVNGVTARTEDHPQHIDITKLILPAPLPPKQQVTITTPFHVKLPYNFSRGGYVGETFQVSQWFPKPAVYDSNGWHPMPYLDQGEFYSEFGNYDVSITLPANYVVAATGELQDENEKEWLRKRKDFSWSPIVTRTAKSKNAPVKKTTQLYPSSDATTKTIRYQQENVHDFAWFADKRFSVHMDTLQLNTGRVIDIYTYYLEKDFQERQHVFDYARDAARFYSNEIGDYPYQTISVVHGPESFGGGMEYPTITIISPIEDDKQLDRVIAHEIGHNWFQGILASNERAHPWMDEGINSFYEYKYMRSKYGIENHLDELIYLTKAKRNTAQAIGTHSQEFSSTNYGLVTYHRTATWLREVEDSMGSNRFNKMMRSYYEEWKFKHPQPGNFINTIKEYSGWDSNLFNAMDTVIPPRSTGFSVVSPLIKGSIKNYLRQPTRNILFLSPSAGINSYDRLMVGALVSNYKLPPTNFNFLLVPMYGTGSRKFTGLGRLNYSIHSKGRIRKTDLFVNASQFSMDQFKDSADRKLVMQFKKLAPGIRITFKEDNPRSTINRYIKFTSFLFNEQNLRIYPDTVIQGTDTSLLLRYLLPRSNRYVNQLKFVYENYRALYPFDLELQLEQSQDFIRPALITNYFFNYKEGGLQLRLFAGGFLYLNGKTISKQFKNDRYHLNMTGANGYEDYTYSNYFMGRNHFEGLESQQIMMRDGGFKVRTDLLASKIGKTDRWLTAVNLNSSIPDRINPLSVLPIKIPVRIFLDIGTYAEAWDKDAEGDKFLYDMGIHLPLFNEMLNIYIPLFYNKVFSDYYKSTIPKNRFLKTISFSINFYNKDTRQINRELEF